MACQHLLPFLVGEIDIGGDGFLIWDSGCGRSLRLFDRGYHRLQFGKHVFLRHGCGVVALVIEAVAAGLQFSGLHAPVGAVRHHRCAGIVELSSDAAQVESLLHPRCPSQKRPAHHVVRRYGNAAVRCDPAVFAHADAVAVKSHRHTPVGVAGMDKIFRHVEVCGDNARKCVVCLAVGGVGAPVGKGFQLFLCDGIVQQRGIMPLHEQGETVAACGHMSLHPVSEQDILQFGRKLKGTRIGVCPYRHDVVLFMRFRFPVPRRAGRSSFP